MKGTSKLYSKVLSNFIQGVIKFKFLSFSLQLGIRKIVINRSQLFRFLSKPQNCGMFEKNLKLSKIKVDGRIYHSCIYLVIAVLYIVYGTNTRIRIIFFPSFCFRFFLFSRWIILSIFFKVSSKLLCWVPRGSSVAIWQIYFIDWEQCPFMISYWRKSVFLSNNP